MPFLVVILKAVEVVVGVVVGDGEIATVVEVNDDDDDNNLVVVFAIEVSLVFVVVVVNVKEVSLVKLSVDDVSPFEGDIKKYNKIKIKIRVIRSLSINKENKTKNDHASETSVVFHEMRVRCWYVDYGHHQYDLEEMAKSNGFGRFEWHAN